jgi:hypothetical protein
MYGTYGHEAWNQESSRMIFNQSLQKKLEEEKGGEPLVTGYSCRRHIKRLAGHELKHPLEVLLGLYRQTESTNQKR